MEHIVFLDRSTLKADVRRPAFPHTWNDHQQTTGEEIQERVRDATIVITNKVPLRAETLQQLSKLRLIALAATGSDHIDLDYCRSHGIAVANIRNYATHTLPEHVFMLILALRRNLIEYNKAVREGRWQRAIQFSLFDHSIQDLYGSTLGIIGYGSLGRAVANIAQAFGMRVLISEHKDASVIRENYTAFEQVIQQSDVLTLHSPLTPATRHMIAMTEFKKMKPNLLLINTARGGLVHESDLAEALTQNLIAGAGLDVLTKEPPKDGNVLLDLNLPNLILTPHVAWASQEAMQSLADQLIDNIEAFIDGHAKNLLT